MERIARHLVTTSQEKESDSIPRRNSPRQWIAGLSLRQRLALSFLFAALICIPLCLAVRRAPTDDDYSIAFYLSGRLPDQGLSLFVNAILSNLIYALGTIWPQVSWFFVIERLTSFLAFWGLAYATLSYVRFPAGLLMLGFVTWFALPNCISTSNFTFVSGLCATSGVLLLVSRIGRDEAGKPSLCAGVALLLLGLLWRDHMFYAALPFFAAALFGKVLICEFDRKIACSCIVSLLLVCVASVGAIAIDRIQWSADGWQQWRENNDQRSAISDLPMPEWEDVSDELLAMGISENDYDMLLTWATADTDVFDNQVLARVAELRKPVARGPRQVLKSVRAYGRMVLARRWYFGIIILATLLSLPKKKRLWAIVAIPFSMAFCMGVYFLLLKRLVDRVEVPVWCYALAATVALSEKRPSSEPAETRDSHWVLQALPAALMLVLLTRAFFAPMREAFQYMDVRNVSLAFNQSQFEPKGELTTYIASHPDQSFVITAHMNVLFEREYDYLYHPDPEIAMRAMPLGGWGTNAPCRLAQARRLGASNPVTALMQPDGALLIAGDEPADRLLVFLQEHYDERMGIEKVDSINKEISVWRYAVDADA